MTQMKKTHPITKTLSLIGLVLVAQTSRAAVEPITLSSDEKWPAPRWIYGIGEVPKGDTPTALLAAAKVAQIERKFDVCLKKSDAARPKAKSLHAWIATVEIDCAQRVVPVTPASATRLAKALDRVEANPSWLLKGPQAVSLRTIVAKAYQTLIDQDLKTNKARAWQSIDVLESLEPFLDAKARAALWRSAGELALSQQKNEAARDFMRRSLREVDAAETRGRLSAIELTLASKDPTLKTAETKPLEPKPVLTLEASKEELELVDRVTAGLKAGDLVSSVEDAVKIIKGYPGSTRAKWAADRIMEAYSSIAEKSDPKYTLLREQIVKHMENADGERIGDWARSMYSKGQWEDSYMLAKKSVEKLDGARSTGVIDLAAKAALATDRFEVARDYFDRLVLQHSGQTAAREAQFRAGLVNYRLGMHAQAVADFERVIAQNSTESFDLLARYWLWRSLQKMKSDRAILVADEMMKKYPFSYYGLRARFERNANVLEWKPETGGKVEAKIWLTGNERLAWERAQLLLKAGWLEEAQVEIKELPEPFAAEEKAVRALVWAAASQYVRSSKLVNEAWDEKAEFRRPPFVGASFPTEFSSFIAAQATNRKLDRYLVQGLIKQESGYNARAVSSANAAGLMQMIPPTAKEIAFDLKLGTLEIPEDLFVPSRNIQMGTYYLARLVNKYQGNIPLALAGYNAGPARLDRWLRARPSLKNVITTKSSLPDDELWFDEIPYMETSFYVKSILRNLLIYKMLDQGRVEVSDPVWSYTPVQ